MKWTANGYRERESMWCHILLDTPPGGPPTFGSCPPVTLNPLVPLGPQPLQCFAYKPVTTMYKWLTNFCTNFCTSTNRRPSSLRVKDWNLHLIVLMDNFLQDVCFVFGGFFCRGGFGFVPWDGFPPTTEEADNCPTVTPGILIPPLHMQRTLIRPQGHALTPSLSGAQLYLFFFGSARRGTCSPECHECICILWFCAFYAGQHMSEHDTVLWDHQWHNESANSRGVA